MKAVHLSYAELAFESTKLVVAALDTLRDALEWVPSGTQIEEDIKTTIAWIEASASYRAATGADGIEYGETGTVKTQQKP